MSENNEQKTILFKKGILGFEEYKEYIVLKDNDSSLYYLQSVDDASVEFVLISPYLFAQDYAPVISEKYFQEIGGGEDIEFIMYLIVRLDPDPDKISVNLQAPIIIHLERREGVQAIADGDKYGIRESLAKLIKGSV